MKKELSIRLSLLGRVKLFVAGWADAYANLWLRLWCWFFLIAAILYYLCFF